MCKFKQMQDEISVSSSNQRVESNPNRDAKRKQAVVRVVILLCLSLFMCIHLTYAQGVKKEFKNRRNSMYSIMLLDNKIDATAKTFVKKAFETTPIPDKYNDHNLAIRYFDKLDDIEVTSDEIAALEKAGAKKKKGFGSLLKSATEVAGSVAGVQLTQTTNSEAEYAAKLMKYFNENHIANQLIAKWYNGKKAKANCFDYNLIADRGLYNATQEDIAKAKLEKGGKENIMDNASLDLIPKTFILVNRFSYLSAEDLMTTITAASSAVGGALGQYTSLASSAVGAVLKGYFVKTTSYLFRLDWNEEIQKNFETNYWDKDITTLLNSNDFKISYVGKTFDYAPATLKLTLNDDLSTSGKLITRATVRAIDGGIAKLQKKYDEYKTVSPLYVEGDNCYAYIGLKEGLAAGDKYEVLQRTEENGKEIYKQIGTVKVAKNKIWDNRFGADEILDGGAVSNEEKGDASLKYTSFDGGKEKFTGCYIRQIK